jgi:hypothetical protein
MSILATAKRLEIPADPLEKDALLLRQQEEIQHLKQELSQLKRMIFGQKRERFVPAVPEEQMALEALFETAGATIPGFAESKETIIYDRRKPVKGHGRNPMPDDLHREQHVLDVAESEKICSCGNEKKHIGDEVTEELEYKPAVFFVNQFIRPKYACPLAPTTASPRLNYPSDPSTRVWPGPGYSPISLSANMSIICPCIAWSRCSNGTTFISLARQWTAGSQRSVSVLKPSIEKCIANLLPIHF